MWHIFPLWLVRHVVMCLLIAGLKDKPLIFASDVVNDLSTSVFLFPEREREGKTGNISHISFSSPPLCFMIPLDLWRVGHHWLRWAFVVQELWTVFSHNSNSSTSSTGWSNFQIQLCPTHEAHFPNPLLMPKISTTYLQKSVGILWRKKSHDQNSKSLTYDLLLF